MTTLGLLPYTPQVSEEASTPTRAVSGKPSPCNHQVLSILISQLTNLSLGLLYTLQVQGSFHFNSLKSLASLSAQSAMYPNSNESQTPLRLKPMDTTPSPTSSLLEKETQSLPTHREFTTSSTLEQYLTTMILYVVCT